MAALALVFFAAALSLPVLWRWLARRVFLLAGLVGAVGFVVTALQGPTVLAGETIAQTTSWIGLLHVHLSFRMDALAWVMALLVTGVGCLVLVYCARYFADDDRTAARFGAYLLGFAGAMYGLVTADDVFVLYLFWEITSVLSYLLIGHYTARSESRAAGLQALIVTTFGGLAMLVGLVMLAGFGGTSSLSGLIASGLHGTGVTWAIVLILAGALSKSALIPFHFWLPSAMAAPTPVSAYLHAAAMVKAGVYLVLRLVPGFGDTPGWQAIIVTLGVWTMLVGAWRALRQYDLKLLLAYSTVSQLGFIMVAGGLGTRTGALAGLAMIVAHALFKAALFLTVGVIEKRTGVRDWRLLSQLGRRAPVLATTAGLALASMAGIIPLAGFVGKESVFAALIERAAVPGGGVWGVVVAAVVVASALTVAYCARFFWGAFASRALEEKDEGMPLARASVLGLAPAAILSVSGLVAGLGAAALNAPLTVFADTVGAGPFRVALWHGFGWPLACSAAALALGAALFAYRARVATLQGRMPALIDLARGYSRLVAGVNRWAARLTIAAQRGGLRQYLGTILTVFVLTAGAAAVTSGAWPTEFVWWDYPAQAVIGVVMIVAAVMAARVTGRITAVILAGVTGYGIVLLFGLHAAPDLALTQALVESVTLVAFVLVVRRLPRPLARQHRSGHRVLRAALGVVAGLTMGAVALIALGSRRERSISEQFPDLIRRFAHGDNIVNTILVDVRGWDTMGEISVLVVVATGIASFVFVTGRSSRHPRMQDSRRLRSGLNRARVVADPAAASEGQAITRQTWLMAGRAIPERDRSIMLEVLVRILFHPAMVLSVYFVFVGHDRPGGGFIGGLVAGLALIMRYLVGGRYELVESLPIDPGKLLGLGIIFASGTAGASLLWGADALTAASWSATLPVLGDVSLNTSTIFDVGVYLVVVGVALDLLRSLGSEIDIHAERGGTASGISNRAARGVKKARSVGAQAGGGR